MGVEIERKFLIRDDSWRAKAGEGVQYKQGYLSTDPGRTVRVRLAGDQGYITTKAKGEGIERLEFEYEIPGEEAAEMLEKCALQPTISKKRYRLEFGRHVYEVDEFEGRNAGLLVAEIELQSSYEVFDRPAWLGKEVTEDARYLNANLVENPYDGW